MPVWSNSTYWFRTKTADKKLCRRWQDPHQKHYAPTSPPPFFFCFVCFFFGVGVHNLALTDPVVSEKMFEECGRRHRRACLYDKLTNQYIKRSARIIRSKICRIKMTYTFEDTVKEDNQIKRDFTAYFFVPDQSPKNDFEMRFWSETVLRKLTGQTFLFINSTFQMLYFIGRGFTEVQILKKWNGPISWTLWNSEEISPAHWYWQDLGQGVAKYHCPFIGRGFADVQTLKTWKLPIITLEP